MINVSSAFKERMKEDRDFRLFAEVTFADGTETTLDGSQFTASGCSISDGADVSSFPLGEAAEKISQIEILNDREQFADKIFLGAKIRLYIEFDTGESVERIEKGTYTVISPETYGETVIITACDDMYKADRDYTTALEFPQTAGAVLRDICGTCGISLGTVSFLHDGFMIRERPAGSFREVIGQISLIACGNARIDRRNRLEIITYDFSGWEEDEGVGYHTLDEFTAPKIGYSDTEVTGFKAVVGGDTQEDDREILVGNDAYCVTVDDPLIAGQEETVLPWLMERIGNVKFRTFSGDAISNPLVEFMDLAKVRDRRGNTYRTFVTDVDFRIPGYTVLKNSTPAMSRSALAYPSGVSRVEQRARQLVESERTARELAVERLSEALTDASGLYETEEKQPDGSVVRYLHDKPGRAESKTVIKLTGEGIGISADGGKNYPWGITFTGEAILDLIYAVGINCDYLTAGAITVKDDGGTVIFSVDIDTGKVVISGDSVQIGGRSAAEAVADAASAAASAAETANTALDEARKSTNLTIVLSNDYEGIPTDHAGVYTPPLSASTAVSVYYGHADVSASCKYSCAASAGVTGTWSGALRTYTVTALSADTGWVDITADYMSLFQVTKRFNVAKVKGGVPGTKGDKGDTGEQGIPGQAGPAGDDGAGYSSNILRCTNTVTALTSTGRWENGTWRSASGGTGTRTSIDITDCPSPAVTKGWSLSFTTGSSPVDIAQDNVPVTNGMTYTMSCYARGTGALRLQYGKNPYPVKGYTLSNVKAWTRYAFSFTIGEKSDGSTGGSTNIYFGNNGVGTVEICGMKLETGSVEAGKTIWTPAPQDLKGADGKDGATSYFHIKYAPVSAPTAAQMTETPDVYIGTYVDYTQADSTDPGKYTWARFQGIQGKDGAQGIPGTNGTNGQTSYLHIKYSDDGGKTFTANGGETAGDWIGQYVDFTQADSASPASYTWSRTKGDTGTQGINLLADSAKEVTSSASANREFMKYADLAPIFDKYGTVEYTVSFEIKSADTSKQSSVQVYMQNGSGSRYTFSEYVPVTTEYTHQKVTVTPQIKDPNEKESWLAFYGTYNTGNIPTVRNVKVELGAVDAPVWTPAPQDLEARTYMIELSANVLKRGANNAVTPTSLTASAYYRDGKSTARTSYAGRWVVATSADGKTFTTAATSGDAASYSYAVGSLAANIVAVRVTLYAAGGVTQPLDMQTLPVIVDIASLTHEQIFNLLTNNGALQGIYQEGGNLYINGAYIKAGTVSATQLAANAVTADKISAGAVNADKLAANAVTADKLAANAVTAGKIASGAITADKIAAGAITADKLAAGAITADKIAAGAITADKLAAGAITADKITIGNFSNLSVVNPDGANPYGAEVVTSGGKKYFRFGSSSTAGYYRFYLRRFSAENTFALGDAYCLRATGFATGSPGVSFVLRAQYTDGTSLNMLGDSVKFPSSEGSISMALRVFAVPNKPVSSYMLFFETANCTGQCYLRDITVYSMATPELIVNGSVTAEKISVSTLSAITADLGTVTAGTVQSANYVSGRTGMKLTLSDGAWDSPNFKVSSTGTLTATAASITGNITATSGKLGGWTLNSTQLYNGTITSNSTGNFGMSTANFTRTVGGKQYTDLRLAIGSNFGVASDGSVYCGSLCAQGYLTGGSWESGKFIVQLNELGLCISTPSQTASVGGYKAWIVTMNSSGALVAIPGRYYGGSWYTYDSLAKSLGAWSSGGGGTDHGGGGGGGTKRPVLVPIA